MISVGIPNGCEALSQDELRSSGASPFEDREAGFLGNGRLVGSIRRREHLIGITPSVSPGA